uniref:Tetraspanin n=1 Tax=Clastoptera arizonana TaxID=38151 RepID=A0A1B6C476_9HEMI
MGLTGCFAILKYFIFFINLVLWITGLTIVVLSIWMLIDPTFYISMAQDESSYTIGIYVFLIIGTLMFIVGFLGCTGVIKESQGILTLFSSLLVIILVAEVSAGAWAYTNSMRLQEFVKENVKNTVLQEYGQVSTRTELFDVIQQGLKCCGADRPSDWSGSHFNKAENKGLNLAISSTVQPYKVPNSCCAVDMQSNECRDALEVVSHHNPQIIFSEGCTEKLLVVLTDNMSIIVGLGVAVGLAQWLGLIFALVLCCAIQQRDKYKA